MTLNWKESGQCIVQSFSDPAGPYLTPACQQTTDTLIPVSNSILIHHQKNDVGVALLLGWDWVGMGFDGYLWVEV